MRLHKVLVGCVVVVLVILISRPTREEWPLSWQANLSPGDSFAIPLRNGKLLVQVPSGPEEGHSLGTFRITGDGFDSGPLERDGKVETFFRHDANEDGQDDLTLVIRSPGSSSYITVISLLSNSSGYTVYHLPDPPTELTPGYSGHDRVTVAGTRLTRHYPSYINSTKIRVDRQWSPSDLARGESPIKASPDSNAAPSGADEEVSFSFASQTWQ
ncbi:MAG: hypothetical protein ACI8W8_003401 [Rhodothermales bacterium]|jgi:hypothetical protein